MERFFTRKVIICLTILAIVTIHLLVHYHEDQGISRNEAVEIEAAKHYEKPKLDKVVTLHEPKFETIQSSFAQKDSIIFIFLVEQTEGSRFRKQVSTEMKKFTDSFLFIQLSSTVDDWNDQFTFFIQSSNFFNPWAVIIQALHGKLTKFMQNCKHVVFVSSKSYVNYPLFPVFRKILEDRTHSSVWSAPREDIKVERNPEKSDFVPSFLYKPQEYPQDSFNDGFIVLSATRFSSLSESISDNSFLPLGVYFYNEMSNYLKSEPLEEGLTRFMPKTVVLLKSEVSSDLCKLNSSFLTTDFADQKEVELLKASTPEHGYKCIPYINFQLNNIYLIIVTVLVGGCCCCQCIGGFVAAMAMDPKNKQKHLGKECCE